MSRVALNLLRPFNQPVSADAAKGVTRGLFGLPSANCGSFFRALNRPEIHLSPG